MSAFVWKWLHSLLLIHAHFLLQGEDDDDLDMQDVVNPPLVNFPNPVYGANSFFDQFEVIMFNIVSCLLFKTELKALKKKKT